MSELWIRAETKPQERRAPLTPADAGKIVSLGHTVYVERSKERTYADEQYEMHGCILTKAGSWESASSSSYVLGLKDLPESDEPIIQQHIYFAHAYNSERVFTEKPDSERLIRRFNAGGGRHFDIEFLLDESGRRVAAFGESAGRAGTLLTLLLWSEIANASTTPFSALPYIGVSCRDLESLVGTALKSSPLPKCLVIGGRGRCGTGVLQALSLFDIECDVWGRSETSITDSDRRILSYDILFNCAYVTEKGHAFLTRENLKQGGMLRIISDISCETSGNNPLPIYVDTTSFHNPVHSLACGDNILSIIAIDNLPTLIPKESSEEFSRKMLPQLEILLRKNKISHPWISAAEAFNAIR
jgi:saccharopine dehydrogenase (NAD+, L-lysine-forming)